jgi:hypothetical protein
MSRLNGFIPPERAAEKQLFDMRSLSLQPLRGNGRVILSDRDNFVRSAHGDAKKDLLVSLE